MTSKVVFITGAANGIGAATARKFISLGWRVGLCDINESAVLALAEELGENAAAWRADVCKYAELEQAINNAAEKFGQLDAVIANAGIAMVNPVVTMPEDEWLKVIDVNLNGVWRTLKASSLHLIKSKGYALVISSVAAGIALPYSSHYTASKAAVLNLAESYRAEIKSLGVDVGTFHPSFVKTALVTDAFATDYGVRILKSSKLVFMDFPLKWTVNGIVKSVIKRRRRGVAPFWYSTVISFPRASNYLVNLWAWGDKFMKPIITDALEQQKQSQKN